MRYECEGCDAVFEGTYADAFEKGWDTPERFGQHITCPDCPITVTAWYRAAVEKKELSAEQVETLRRNMEIHLAAGE